MPDEGAALPPPTGRTSTVLLPRYWYVACLGRDLTRGPLARQVLGVPLCLFRDQGGRAVAVLDRCPHRNVPLSLGRCTAGELECEYHGWRFDGAGRCRAVPGLVGEPDRAARAVPTFRTHERDGFVWVVPSHDEPMVPAPPAVPEIADPEHDVVWLQRTMPGSLHAVLENALDVPHTAFLHRGLFRGRRTPVPVEVTVRVGAERAEAVFEGEPVPPGIIGRLLAPGGGVIEHTDRFLVPSTAQVEYRLGVHHVLLTAAYTPVSADETALHAAAAFRLPVPTPLARAAVLPLARQVLRQDARILAHQRDALRRFGGESFASTPIDVLGSHIARLMRRAARAEAGTPDATAVEERVTLLT